MKQLLIFSFLLLGMSFESYARIPFQFKRFKRPLRINKHYISMLRWKCRHTSTSFKCVEFVRNYDGDTITVNIPKVHTFFGKEMSIRVRGVDTPEIRTKDDCEKAKAYEAKEFVNNLLIKAKKINLENIDKDKYFRIVADIKFDGKNIAQNLIDSGLAYPYDGGTKKDIDWCMPLDQQLDPSELQLEN